MSTLRMTGDLRRQLILGAAKRCFARNGFAGTTTRSVAAAASISEALLFKHFPSKAALYAEILAEECEADAEFAHLLGQEPSTETLVQLVRGMVRHFLQVAQGPDEEEAQRLRLMLSSQLDDGEFARILYGKIADMIEPVFAASLEQAVASGEASAVPGSRLNLFWFAHHTVLMTALSRMPGAASLDYGDEAALEQQLCGFLLRGVGLHPSAIASHLSSDPSQQPVQSAAAESA